MEDIGMAGRRSALALAVVLVATWGWFEADVAAAETPTSSAARVTAPRQTVRFTSPPKSEKAGDGWTISFAVSAPTDVEAAILDRDGAVVRHLAAGMVGIEKSAPPLAPGLAQTLTWDGRDDFGTTVVSTLRPPTPTLPHSGGRGITARVRLGSRAVFGRFIGGDDPYTFGRVESTAVDAQGRLYVMGFKGQAGHNHMTLRVFDADGRYLRTILPFPASLPPDAVGPLARWDAEAQTFRPRNIINRAPSFYEGTNGDRGRGDPLSIFLASENEVLLTDGASLYRLDGRGGVRDGKFKVRDLWTGAPPRLREMRVALSPDGAWAYVTGPRSAKSQYGHKYDPRYPPGVVYRLNLKGDGPMERFVAIDVAHQEGVGGVYLKNLGDLDQQYAWGEPIEGVAVDRKENVYVADREHQCVVVFDPQGREVGAVDVKCPSDIAVHPETGAVYVLQRARLAWQGYQVRLLKFDRLALKTPPSVERDLPPSRLAAMFLWTGRKEPLVTLTRLDGLGFRLTTLRDAGAAFEPVETAYQPQRDAQWDWQRLTCDYGRDEVYGSDGAVGMWRYDGRSGRGEYLGKREQKPGFPFFCQEIAVGYDGRLYARTFSSRTHPPGSASGYSGPFERLDHDLKPVPYAATGTHVLSPYIYSRQGTGYAERGFGIGPDGTVYISWMYPGWATYAITGFGPEGKPLKGRYMVGQCDAGNHRRGTPADVDSAVIGPITGANGGLRVDLAGNLYVGLWVWPKDVAPPEAFAKDLAYLASTGSVVKFTRGGGFMSATKPDWGSDAVGRTPVPAGATGLELRSGYFSAGRTDDVFVGGAVDAYPGYAPFSHTYFGGNTCCVCRSPRFDLDRFGRLYLPNAITNSVRIVDNAGNEVLEFGRYGNFDDASSTPGSATVPLGWPTAAGVTKDAIYVCDTLNRRAVRVEHRFAVESVVEIE
jgi:hypothetical protein